MAQKLTKVMNRTKTKVFYSTTVVIDDEGFVIVVDNTKEDYTDYVNDKTISITPIKPIIKML